MDKLLRRIFLLSLVGLAGCAAFDSPFKPTPAGIANAGVSDEFVSYALQAERDLASMHDAICAAGAMTSACGK